MSKFDCPECGGYGHYGIEEDSGAPLVCYFCGATGSVSAEVMADIEREREEQDLLRTYLPNCRQRPVYDEWDGEVIPPRFGLFVRLDYGLRSKPAPRPVPMTCDDFDDIPF